MPTADASAPEGAFQRLELLVGADTVGALAKTRAVVVGAGGVGSWCAEALVRSGVGHITLIDSDAVCVTNINRQVEALVSTVGKDKVPSLAERLRAINPACEVVEYVDVFSRETKNRFGIESADYVIDAIDSLTHKLDLIEYVESLGAKLFSSMGTAQKLDPTLLKTAGIWQTQGCPLARLVRQGLRKRGFAGDFLCVFSTERIPGRVGEAEPPCGKPMCYCARRGVGTDWCASKKVINGSAVTVTATAGMILASLVVRDVWQKRGISTRA
jgi:tRNA A37 threonylcarbamoyladenosine dehydratase